MCHALFKKLSGPGNAFTSIMTPCRWCGNYEWPVSRRKAAPPATATDGNPIEETTEGCRREIGIDRTQRLADSFGEFWQAAGSF
jgi:hypothetical protein